MLRRKSYRTFALLVIACISIAAGAQNHASIDLNLGEYGFKGIPSRDVLKGSVLKPNCLFLDENHVAVIAPVRERPKLSMRGQDNSLPLHYVGVVINLNTSKIVSHIDLGGADDNSTSESLSSGDLVFYHHGTIDFWRLGTDQVLRKRNTASVDVHKIDQAWIRTEQAQLSGLFPSVTHNTIYLYLDAPLSNISAEWKITSDGVEAIRQDLPQIYLEPTTESDSFLISPNWGDPGCKFYVISDRSGVSPIAVYSQNPCTPRPVPSVIGRSEIAFTSDAKGTAPQFRTDMGEIITHPGVDDTDSMMAAWDGSDVMATLFHSSGGFEALDISSHISSITVTIFKNWHRYHDIRIKVHGADFSGPYISPRGGWVVIYDYGHFYAWNV